VPEQAQESRTHPDPEWVEFLLLKIPPRSWQLAREACYTALGVQATLVVEAGMKGQIRAGLN
jgi:hypothetical protein